MKQKKPKKSRYGEDYEYSPVRQNVTSSTLVGGLVIRAVTTVLLNMGFLIFLNNCFSLGVGFGSLLVYALIWGTVFSLMFIGGKATLAGLGLFAVTGGIWVFINQSIATYIRACVECTMNTVGTLLVARGFDNMSFLVRPYAAIDTAAALNGGTLFMLSCVFAFILSLCTMRKTVLIPTVLLTALVCIPGITFNLPSSNWGAAFIILSLFAIVTMKFFDKTYKAKRADRLRRASMGGYAGGAVALIAFICISVPALFMQSNWADIPAISEPMDVARDVVTSVISGDMPNLRDMGLIKGMDDHNSRVVDPKQVTFTGDSVLKVYRNISDRSPMYLRGWVAGGGFDGSAWYSATNDMLEAFQETMSQASVDAGYSESYSPDFMTEAFFELLGDNYSSIDETLGYTDYSDNGYLALRTNVSIETSSGTGNLLFLPSISVTSGGLSAFESDSEYSNKVIPSYDGMLLTNFLNFNKAYSVDTYTTTFSKPDAAENFMYLISYVQAISDFIDYYHNGGMNQSASVLTDVYSMMMIESGVPVEMITFDFLNDYINMDRQTQELYYNRYVVLVDVYTQYVEANYGYQARYNNSFITNIAKEINVNSYDTQHSIVMKVIQHMASNYTYTTDPELGTAQGLTPYESFLGETKEGYCTQFATTVALVLRELGIPARYVEGYIAKNFFADENGGYVSEVTDENAHAWVEVYYPGYGWMTYETTNRYAQDYYGTDISVSGDSVDLGDDQWTEIPENPVVTPPEPPEEIPPEGITDEPETRSIPWGKIFRIVIVVGALAVGLFLLIRYLKRTGDDAVYRRRQLLSEASGGVDAEEYRMVSHNVNQTLLGIMIVAGYPPQAGELPSQYAKRLDATCQYATGIDFSEIMTLIQRQEFSTSMSNADLRAVAEYTEMFWNDVYRNMSRPKQIWYRYIKRYL